LGTSADGTSGREVRGHEKALAGRGRPARAVSGGVGGRYGLLRHHVWV